MFFSSCAVCQVNTPSSGYITIARIKSYKAKKTEAYELHKSKILDAVFFNAEVLLVSKLEQRVCDFECRSRVFYI